MWRNCVRDYISAQCQRLLEALGSNWHGVEHLLPAQFCCSGTVFSKDTAILCCRMRVREAISTGEPSTKGGARLSVELLGTSCHTASAKLGDDMVNKFHVAAGQGGVDDVDAINARVLPLLEFIHDLFGCTGYPGGLRPETCQITHGHVAVGIHGTQFRQMAARTFGNQLADRGIEWEVAQINAQATAGVGHQRMIIQRGIQLSGFGLSFHLGRTNHEGETLNKLHVLGLASKSNSSTPHISRMLLSLSQTRGHRERSFGMLCCNIATAGRGTRLEQQRGTLRRWRR